METVEWAVLASLIVVGLTTIVMTIGLGVLRKFVGLRSLPARIN